MHGFILFPCIFYISNFTKNAQKYSNPVRFFMLFSSY